VVPNHLAQLLTLTAIEQPGSYSDAALQNEQEKALESAPPINPEECSACVIRGTFGVKLPPNARTAVVPVASQKALGFIGNAPAHELWPWRNAVRRSIFDKPTWRKPL
jgi:hypothetical protein